MTRETQTPRTDAAEKAAGNATTYCLDGWKLARTLETHGEQLAQALRECLGALRVDQYDGHRRIAENVRARLAAWEKPKDSP